MSTEDITAALSRKHVLMSTDCLHGVSQVEEELWEEEFMERCFQEMLEEEEQWEWFIPSRDLPQEVQELVVSSGGVETEDMGNVGHKPHYCPSVLQMKSSLNPNAKEFTPGIQKHVM